MFSLVETAKANGTEPYAYLQHIVGHIAAACTEEAIDALTPTRRVVSATNALS